MSDAIEAPRFINKRQRALELQARMLAFPSVYNSACVLRHAWHGSAVRREQCARALADAVAKELQRDAVDYEALLYAIADSLYASPLGTPWE